MALTKQQLKIFYLGGTVAIPASQLGFISIDDGAAPATLRVEETHQGSRVARTVALPDVAAIFIPSDPDANLSIGSWFYRDLDGGITSGALGAIAQSRTDAEKLGVVYVREDAPVLVEASVGAAESENFATSMIRYLGCNG